MSGWWVGVEQDLSETAGVGGAVMSECGDRGVLAPSSALFNLLFFGLSSGMISAREARPPEEEWGCGVNGEDEEESCPNR